MGDVVNSPNLSFYLIFFLHEARPPHFLQIWIQISSQTTPSWPLQRKHQSQIPLVLFSSLSNTPLLTYLVCLHEGRSHNYFILCGSSAPDRVITQKSPQQILDAPPPQVKVTPYVCLTSHLVCLLPSEEINKLGWEEGVRRSEEAIATLGSSSYLNAAITPDVSP
jgi:hypothetical protein